MRKTRRKRPGKSDARLFFYTILPVKMRIQHSKWALFEQKHPIKREKPTIFR